MINPNIFKAYDIRGIYPEEINEEAAYKIGHAFVKFLNAKKIAVGIDARKSSPSLFKEFVRGITDEGCDVINIGMCTTPMLGFAVAYLDLDGGVMISASHNPPEYNAFKLLSKNSLQLYDDFGIKEVKKLAELSFENGSSKGKIIKKDILPDYVNHLLKFAKDIKNLKTVCDYGNGVGAVSAKEFLDNLPISTTHLFPEPDGSFPNHLANPHELENLKTLQEKVLEEKADLGIFFDGDADRSILVDEKGEIVPPDLELAILAKEELKNHKGEKVYFDLRFSKIVDEVIKETGGKSVMMRVGNPFYKEKLQKEGGVLAGEFSGHIMFKDNYCLDDGLFAAVKIMGIMSRTKKPLSELIKPFKKYYQTEEINLKVKNPDETLRKVKEEFKDGESINLDGVYIKYSDWWFNLRKSNTEPLVRLRIEADSPELLEEKKREVLNIIEK